MTNPFKRKPKVYDAERQRILLEMEKLNPATDAYQCMMARLNEIDKIRNRTSEIKKTVIPALGGVGAVGGIYMLQQFAGVIVPKALDSYAQHKEKRNTKESEDF